MASAEHERIMGAWGQSPQRGPGAEHFGHWMSNGAGKFSPFSQILQVELQRSLKKSEHSHERYRGKTQRLPRFLREYRGEVPGCRGGVGAHGDAHQAASLLKKGG